MPFPQYIIDYLTPLGFELETESRLSFIPEYKWEKFSLIVTDCNHYSFSTYRLESPLPYRIIFQDYNVGCLDELVFLLSHNTAFNPIWEKSLKRVLHPLHS